MEAGGSQVSGCRHVGDGRWTKEIHPQQRRVDIFLAPSPRRILIIVPRTRRGKETIMNIATVSRGHPVAANNQMSQECLA